MRGLELMNAGFELRDAVDQGLQCRLVNGLFFTRLGAARERTGNQES
jgi:hypothetical protein